VGKSSLINAIVGRKIAEPSKTPGKTQKLYFFKCENMGATIVDCPGYGFAKASHVEKENWRKFMEIYLKKSYL
jgi:GTP-binding protein